MYFILFYFIQIQIRICNIYLFNFLCSIRKMDIGQKYTRAKGNSKNSFSSYCTASCLSDFIVANEINFLLFIFYLLFFQTVIIACALFSRAYRSFGKIGCCFNSIMVVIMNIMCMRCSALRMRSFIDLNSLI